MKDCLRLQFVFLVLLAMTVGTRADLSSILPEGSEVKKLGGGLSFTEGPVWIPAEKMLVFSDIPNSKLMKWTSEGGVAELREVERSNGNLLDLEGRLLSCQHDGRNVIRTEPDGTVTVLADRFEGKRLNSPNDLAILSDGTIWFTDPTYGLGGKPGEVPGKWVYRLAPDGVLSVVSKDYDMPNGIAFSPDEQRVYIADTGKLGTIRAFEVVQEGLLGDPLFEIPIRCDGMCVDTKGNLYTTSRGGIHVFDPDGRKLGLIPVPETPANVCFGGEDYGTLFITARRSLYAVPTLATGAKPRGAKW